MQIFIGNLPPNTQIHEVQNLYQHYGRILKIDINPFTPQYASVFFECSGSAFNAVQGTLNFVFKGYQLQVSSTPLVPGAYALPPLQAFPCVQQIPLNYMPQVCCHYPQGYFPSVQYMTHQIPLAYSQNMQSVHLPKSYKYEETIRKTVKIVETPANFQYSATENFTYTGIENSSCYSANESLTFSATTETSHTPGDLKKSRKYLNNKTIPPSGFPGALDDPYLKMLTGAGIKWYLRYLQSGMSKIEARIKAGAHKFLARGVGKQKAYNLSEKHFAAYFVRDYEVYLKKKSYY